MKVAELVKELASKEGRLSQVSVGDIRELVSILSDLLYAETSMFDPEVFDCLVRNGENRSKRKLKSKKKK